MAPAIYGSFLALSALYKEKLETSFPALCNAHQAPHHNDIAAAIGIMAMQKQNHHEDLRVAKEKKEATSVEAMFGGDQLQGILHLTQTRSEAELCSR